MQDEDGQILEAHSISAGLDYPGAGPSTRTCATPAAPRYVAVTDAEALAAFQRVARLEGIIPALESAHAVAWVLAAPPSRARPRVPARAAATRTWPRCSRRWTRREHRRRADRGRLRGRDGQRGADALPDGRLPRPRRVAAIGEAYADGGADLVELGVPFSDPLADGPVIHAAGTRALRARARPCPRCSSSARALAERVPVVLMCYANLVMARGVERFADELAQRGCQRPDRARPPARGVAGRAGGLRRGRHRARAARRADHARRAAGARSARRPAASSTPSR